MRTIAYDDVVNAVRELCIRAACELPDDVIFALGQSLEAEQSPQGRAALTHCIENAEIARKAKLPICQDTGSAVFFVTLGDAVCVIGGTIGAAINEGCGRGYREGYLRASIVGDPLFDRKNTGDNTPAFVHFEPVAGEKLSITLLPKGGGCENMSALAMLKPADGIRGVTDFVVSVVRGAGGNPCPPVIVGVGIGGTADMAMVLSKKALLRTIGSVNCDERYGNLEQEILKKVNACGNGPQGMGGTVTALAVFIEHSPCHIASLPVAVSLNCHAARQATIRL